MPDEKDFTASVLNIFEEYEKHQSKAKPFSAEFINFLLVNALKNLNEEQRATLIDSLISRTPSWKEK